MTGHPGLQTRRPRLQGASFSGWQDGTPGSLEKGSVGSTHVLKPQGEALKMLGVRSREVQGQLPQITQISARGHS